MQPFQQIRAWHRAHALAVALHRQSVAFQRDGYGALRSQLTRAADSIAANIVEGCGAATGREFARFLDIAIKSANETEYHLLVARDLGLLSPETWERHSSETIEIRKMLHGYRKRVLASSVLPPRPRA